MVEEGAHLVKQRAIAGAGRFQSRAPFGGVAFDEIVEQFPDHAPACGIERGVRGIGHGFRMLHQPAHVLSDGCGSGWRKLVAAWLRTRTGTTGMSRGWMTRHA